MVKTKIKSTKIKRSPGDQFVQVLIYLFVGGFALIALLPFVYIVAGSFATERELTERAFFLFPHTISLNAYQYILKTGETYRGLMNSVIVTSVGVVINMVFSCTLAYPLSRHYFRGRTFFTNMVIITMLFSGGMVPSYMLVANVLHLKDTFWALWLPGAINPFNMIIIKNYFQGIPSELEEASRMDGCNDGQIFLKIILPLSKPVLASVSLFYAVSHWNSYFNAMMYISDRNKEVIQIVLRRIIFLTSAVATESGFDWGAFGMPPEKAVKMATTVVATVPILLVYPYIQKYFTQGVMVGSVKG
ncbi:ABC transporter permease subunit [Anaerocolumna sedimenticola]|uniref:ABC transporter permease subunit n=1 Tax=Anaerocolumna sedimenticola TaxID=2696063 RepID=A0A6P1TH69_9FIRM|nr:carbohydrate ABC transporter permease [Anaerocolumna sedimenticola]QHQ59419.1 ABC transporter permease subunit [Anaerocolumna sedimenticola]